MRQRYAAIRHADATAAIFSAMRAAAADAAHKSAADALPARCCCRHADMPPPCPLIRAIDAAIRALMPPRC